MTSSTHTNYGFVTLVSIVAAVGGLLFGYDTSVISGAIGFMQTKFHLNSAMQGWVVSCLLIGAIIGAALAGFLSDRFGRKKMLIISGLLFTIGSIISALSPTINLFVIARIIGGIGIGISSTLVPLYIAEIAPSKNRGRLVSLNQLAVVIGISAIYFVNKAIVNAGDQSWDVNYSWRWMLGCGLIPGLLFVFLLLLVPESPRWLEKQGFDEKAFKLLEKINGTDQAKKELADIKNSIQKEASGSIRLLFKPGFRIALIIGVVLAILQQVTGINAIMYYAPEIFKKVGAGTNASLTETIIVGLVNFLFTLVSLWLIDKVGRKTLLIIGSAVMTISLAVVGFEFSSAHPNGTLVLFFILLFVAAFAVSFGPIVWLVIAEIFPTNIRGRATAIASVALWLADFVVSQFFPILLGKTGPATTFFIFAILSLFAFIFSATVVRETKGKSLEEIETEWSTH
ncbi:sugar porter family MFS transporter [Pullulanibacillus sp. KACC 23026]|uniref:sugar porter family MFS transporter n=1 Tax=Pullulanibacillus sp. KACC 23026 TaxID=3028315 RepID=UPI0023AF92E1|nr:sugar porter family MFS transporter [Pullulanibacillus sp. KACC 23026]WEG14812.1 sugar porter family MFS transporter [Pullulanibacillus sp. KACC 23026]